MATASTITAYAPDLPEAAIQRLSMDAVRLRRMQIALDAVVERDWDEDDAEQLTCVAFALNLPDGRRGLICGRTSKLPERYGTHLRSAEAFAMRVMEHFLLTEVRAGEAVSVKEVRPSQAPSQAGTIEDWIRWVEKHRIASPATLDVRWAEMLEAEKQGLMKIDDKGLSLTEDGRAYLQKRKNALERLQPEVIGEIHRHACAIADGRRSASDVIASLSEAVGSPLNLDRAGEIIDPLGSEVGNAAKTTATGESWERARDALRGLGLEMGLWQPAAVAFLDHILTRAGIEPELSALLFGCHPVIIDFAGASQSHGCIHPDQAHTLVRPISRAIEEAARSFEAGALDLPSVAV